MIMTIKPEIGAISNEDEQHMDATTNEKKDKRKTKGRQNTEQNHINRCVYNQRNGKKGEPYNPCCS